MREAVDYLRYYAAARRAPISPSPEALPGPTGERNELALHGRGVFACISPWNFPLAIFTGQIAAALAAGNAVVAKPAEQTPLTAAAAVRLLHEAGIPGDVLHLLPGNGETVGARLVADPRVAGVAFTGSTETARLINLALARRPGPIVPLIAETGGQNAMIVDSSALPEQVVADVLTSAFDSAGQRCSSLRVLYVQDDIADRLLAMLTGAMAELAIGDPGVALDRCRAGHRRAAPAKRWSAMPRAWRARAGCSISARCRPAPSTAPSSRRAPSRSTAPAGSTARCSARSSMSCAGKPTGSTQVLDEIAATGYGLTLGIHSRIDETVRHILGRLRIGNTYVNRNMIGAVVGVQPFGGERLSGTGPKAGGPRYLHRFATERTVSIDTTAAGGNASLLSLQDDC